MIGSALRAITGAVLAVGVTWASPLEAQEWRTTAVSRQLSDESRLDVELRHAAGVLRLEPASGRTLYSMELRYDEDAFEPVTDFDGRRLRLGIEGTGRDLRINSDDNQARMNVALSTQVPLDLSLEFGAGLAEVDVGGLRLTDLDVETGASETRMTVSRPNRERLRHARIAVGAAQFTGEGLGNLNADRFEIEAGVGEVILDLTGAWERDSDIEVRMGLGSLELRIPDGLGVKLVKQAFLTSLDAPEMDRKGDAWYSDDWATADRQVTVDVEAAFGTVKVVWLR